MLMLPNREETELYVRLEMIGLVPRGQKILQSPSVRQIAQLFLRQDYRL
jgi:hypothetical protein